MSYKEKIVKYRDPITGRITRSDLVGNKYGRLLVIEFSHMDNTHAKYKCRCNCGNEIIIIGSDLLRKNNPNKSCGCYRRELMATKFLGKEPVNKLPIEKVAINAIYTAHKARAKKQNLDFYLSMDEFKNLISNNCFYCNMPPSNLRKIYSNQKRLSFREFLYSGIDRYDNTLGYIYKNCVPCCWVCNQIKKNYSVINFYGYIEKIYINLKKKDLI